MNAFVDVFADEAKERPALLLSSAVAIFHSSVTAIHGILTDSRIRVA